MDKYAIVIVTYNRKTLLEECISNAMNQTKPAEKIVIVNNDSTDGTAEYLNEDRFYSEKFEIIHCSENVGGAGGFHRGMKAALKYDIDWILMIDDDAILSPDYVEKILTKLGNTQDCQAAAGIVMVNGQVDRYHRRRLSKHGMFLKLLDNAYYQKAVFTCDIASFCGMLVKKGLVEKIGLPHSDYFIFHDDTEYSLRISQYSRFLVVTDAVLNHKTKHDKEMCPRRYDWKDYYAIRNRILMIKEHGSIADNIINYIDIFIRVVFRNWVFHIIKRDHYDWKYECRLVKEAIRNAENGKRKNVLIKREG